jgi:hypothetical protein
VSYSIDVDPDWRPDWRIEAASGLGLSGMQMGCTF